MPPQRPARIDPFLPFVIETLERHPRLAASRLFQMASERGYRGSASHFRHMIRGHRPKPAAEAYARTKTLPGEEAQADWAMFGTITIGRATWKLQCFIMTLSWSRAVFIRFFLSQHTMRFLRGHAAAFEFFGSVPRRILYDNTKNVVIERLGDLIRYQEDFLAFAAHCRFEPRPVAPYRGNEKGRVERSVRYVRDSFFAGLDWTTLADLNQKAARWMDEISLARPCPGDRTMTVREALLEERESMLALPDDRFPTDERCEVRVGKQPYVRFDRNDYSVPPDHVRRGLLVLADEERVRVLDGNVEIAVHRRSFDKGDVVEAKEHLDELWRRKRNARRGLGVDRLERSAPASAELLRLLSLRRENLGSAVARFLELLDTYGARELEDAAREAAAAGAPHPRSVRHILERRRTEHGLAPLLPIALPNDPRVRDLAVRTHALEPYDQLKPEENDDADDNDAAAEARAPLT